MTILFLESGTDATQGFDFFSAVFGSSSSSAQSKTGPRSVALTGSSSSVSVNALMPSAGGRVSFWTRQSLSSGNRWIFSFGSSGFGLATNSSEVLYLADGLANNRATGVAFTPDTWMHIAIAYTYTNSTTNRFIVWMNGVIVIDATNVTWSSSMPNSSYWYGESGTTQYFDDFYLDDDASLTFPGDIRVTAKLPNALSTNNFDTLVGSGTNRYDRVSERPLSVTNGIQHAAATDVYETFGVQGPGVGDVDISDKHILGYTSWLYGKRGAVLASTTSVGGGSSKVSTHTTTTLNPNAAVPSGSAIVVLFACDSNGNPGTTATCADTKGNTYTSAVQASETSSGGGVRTAIFVAQNVTALATTDTITVTHGAITASAIHVHYVVGALTSGAIGETNSNIQAATTDPTTGSTGTLAQAENAVFAAIGNEDNEHPLWSSLRDLLTINNSACITTGGGAASNIALNSQYKFTEATTALAGGYVGTTGGSTDWTSCIAAIKMQTGAVTTGNPKLVMNATETAITLSTFAGMFTNIASGNPYAGVSTLTVGMRSASSSADGYLYECGVLVAWDENKGHLSNLRRRKPINIRV